MTSVIVMVRRTTLGIVMSGECVWWSSCANAAPTKKGAEDGVAGDESGMAEVTRMIGNAGTASEIELRVEDRRGVQCRCFPTVSTDERGKLVESVASRRCVREL